MIRIDSMFVFLKYIFFTLILWAVLFNVFHYFYTPNYCNRFSWKAELYSFKEADAMKKCINTYVCKIWDSEIKNIGQKQYKDFTCIRRFEAWTIPF